MRVNDLPEVVNLKAERPGVKPAQPIDSHVQAAWGEFTNALRTTVRHISGQNLTTTLRTIHEKNKTIVGQHVRQILG